MNSYISIICVVDIFTRSEDFTDIIAPFLSVSISKTATQVLMRISLVVLMYGVTKTPLFLKLALDFYAA